MKIKHTHTYIYNVIVIAVIIFIPGPGPCLCWQILTPTHLHTHPGLPSTPWGFSTSCLVLPVFLSNNSGRQIFPSLPYDLPKLTQYWSGYTSGSKSSGQRSLGQWGSKCKCHYGDTWASGDHGIGSGFLDYLELRFLDLGWPLMTIAISCPWNLSHLTCETKISFFFFNL